MTSDQHSPRLSNGARIVLAFVAVTYALPALAHAVLDPELRFRCPGDRPDVWAHFLLAAVSIVTASMLASRPGRGTRCTGLPATRRVSPFMVGLTAAGAIAGIASLSAGVSVRYGGVSMADRFSGGSGEEAALTLVLQAIVPLLPWWLLLRDPGLLASRTTPSIALRIALALGSAASINGLSSAVRATVAIAILAFPESLRGMLLADRPGTARRPRAVLAAASVAALAVALAALGMRAKTGSVGDDETWARYTEPAYFAGRNSTHFQHAMAALEVGIDEGDRTGEFLDRALLTWSDASYRLGVLTGNPSWGARPDPASLSRWTLERFALFEPSGRMARSGSSPSVIGAFALCFPPPWSFVAMGAFSWLLVRWLDWLLAGTPPISWLGCAIIAFGPLRVLTDTPTNLPNPFGIPFIVVALATVARLLSSYAAAAQPSATHERTT